MAGSRMLYGVSTDPHDSLFRYASSQSFLGSRSMLSFEDINSSKSSKRPFFQSYDGDNIINDEYDEYFNQPEKKRRLTVDQIQFLEKSFEIDNKLEPERKVQLARDLGLQPRQVAIWFQNRRARWKTKQMERDYDVLLSSYSCLKADYEGLLKEKEKLNAEVLHLSEKLLSQQKENTTLAQSDTDKPPESPPHETNDESSSESISLKNSAEDYKLEDICSSVLDSDNPHYIDVAHFSLVEAADVSYVFEAEQSDLSQDKEDKVIRNWPYYEFPVEDQVIENWPY